MNENEKEVEDQNILSPITFTDAVEKALDALSDNGHSKHVIVPPMLFQLFQRAAYWNDSLKDIMNITIRVTPTVQFIDQTATDNDYAPCKRCGFPLVAHSWRHDKCPSRRMIQLHKKESNYPITYRLFSTFKGE